MEEIKKLLELYGLDEKQILLILEEVEDYGYDRYTEGRSDGAGY